MSVQLKQNPDMSLGLQGTDADDGGFLKINIPYNTGTVLTQSTMIANRRYIIKAITGVVDATASNAVTATIYRAPSGTALGSGTALHTGTFNLQGTANTNQSLTLSTTASTLDIAAGTRIGAVISGALGAAGNGTLTITLAPA